MASDKRRERRGARIEPAQAEGTDEEAGQGLEQPVPARQLDGKSTSTQRGGASPRRPCPPGQDKGGIVH